MSLLDDIPPEVIRLALDGAEKLARAIVKKLGLADEVAAVERIKNRMLTAAFEEGVDLGLALGELSHGAASIVHAMEDAERDGRARMDFPKDTVVRLCTVYETACVSPEKCDKAGACCAGDVGDELDKLPFDQSEVEP